MINLSFNAGDRKEYKLETIWNNVVYISKIKSYQLDFYYIVT